MAAQTGDSAHMAKSPGTLAHCPTQRKRTLLSRPTRYRIRRNGKFTTKTRRPQRRNIMKSASNIFAVLLLLAGATFSLQGANILPGSWINGKIEWLIIGIIMIAIAIGLLVWRNRQNKPHSDQ